MIIGMDWLEKYKLVLNCFTKTLTYIAEDQILQTINGILKPVSVRQIFCMQLKKFMRKGYKIYVVRFTDLLNENQTSIDEHPVLSEFLDVFPEEIPRLPPQRKNRFVH